MYHTTGLHAEEILELGALVETEASNSDLKVPQSLGIYRALVVTLAYARRNRVQAELAETYGTSQPTISRAISAMTELIARALRGFVPTAEDLDPAKQYIVDGTLLPCWSWARHPELRSGKHKTTGLNVQVTCTPEGQIAWISDPIAGSRHDVYCLDDSGVLLAHNPSNWIADKGYVGRDMITPIKKPTHRDLLDWEKEFNKQVNQVRSVVERSIAHLKTWRILHVDYRRPLATFPTTISAVIGLYFYLLA